MFNVDANFVHATNHAAGHGIFPMNGFGVAGLAKLIKFSRVSLKRGSEIPIPNKLFPRRQWREFHLIFKIVMKQAFHINLFPFLFFSESDLEAWKRQDADQRIISRSWAPETAIAVWAGHWVSIAYARIWKARSLRRLGWMCQNVFSRHLYSFFQIP